MATLERLEGECCDSEVQATMRGLQAATAKYDDNDNAGTDGTQARSIEVDGTGRVGSAVMCGSGAVPSGSIIAPISSFEEGFREVE